MCIKTVEAKDGECRKNGYKRYWVVTNVTLWPLRSKFAEIKSRVLCLLGISHVRTPVFRRTNSPKRC